jgi:glycosyltransferase involved in cell wall biosynthesis
MKDDSPAICVAAPHGPSDAQTFVRAHLARLPGRVQALWGPDLEHAEGAPSPVGVWQYLARLAPGQRQSRPMRALWRRGQARYLKRSGFDVVLAEFGHAGARIAPACRQAGVPLVVQFHGHDAFREDILAQYGAAYRRMFATCAAVVVVSDPMREQVRTLGADPDKIFVNPCGADCALFTPTDPAANPPVFVGVGRFVAIKAPHLTLLAFRRVLDACPEARLRLIGDGPLLPVCRDIAGAMVMESAVEMPGVLPHAAVAEAMRGARAFVQHSVRAANGDSEGSPVAVMEAGAAGLPVVSTRHAGIPETVLHGQTGLLVEEHDVEGMAASMIELARDPALAGRLGRAGRERVCAEFSIEESVGRLAEILSEAARGR